MGTNYYLESNVCPHCERSDEKIHIGKSSVGWCFALHVIPEQGLNTLDDWKKALEKPDTRITNEYGEVVTPETMLWGITDRNWSGNLRSPMRDEQLKTGTCEEGPNNLLRAKIDGIHCVGHGEGTWDYIAGEFS